MSDLTIENRPVIPVRMIPFVTGWKLSPDVVVEMLSKSKKWHRVFIPSFHLMPDNSYQPMLPKEWDVFGSDLKILSNTLHAEEIVEGEHYPEWRKRSIETLPAGTFVWLDDLKAAYKKVNSRTTSRDERPGDLDLNLQPFLNPEMRKLVFEGFYLESIKHGHVDYIPQENQTQGTTITFNELHHYMQLDPFYGYNSVAVLSIINDLYNGNAANDLFQKFEKRFSRLPCKADQVRHLIYYWCGLMGLPTYQNGKPSNWKREDFLDHWTIGFDLNIDELKQFLRANNWPLPVNIFPNELDNTERKLALDEEEFRTAFHDFTVVLPQLKMDLAELIKTPPESMEARQQKIKETEELERRIDAIINGDKIDTEESPDERKQRLKIMFEEEQALRGERGALTRAAKREGIARQTFSGILNR